MKRTNKLKRIQTAIDYTLRTDTVQKGLNKVSMSKAEVIQGRGLLEHVQMLLPSKKNMVSVTRPLMSSMRHVSRLRHCIRNI